MRQCQLDSSRYSILFEPIAIGPVTAPNRFYQVPHCNGMGHRFPRSSAMMRGIKAEGGGALAGIELVYQGVAGTNHYSRLPALGPSHAAVSHGGPAQARAMSRGDIRELRRWHRVAALRARDAGFDIVYVPVMICPC